MTDNWTEEQDRLIAELIGDNGYTYGHVANHFRTHNIREDATDDSIRSRARRIGATPAQLRPAATPRVETGTRDRETGDERMEPGIKGGERFQRLVLPVKPGERIIVISDAQIPFHDAKTVDAVEHFMDDFQPDHIIWDGDMTDFYGLSKYDKNPSRTPSIQQELDITWRMEERQAKRFPNSSRTFILGNHEDRLRRHLWEHPQLASLRSLTVDSIFSQDGMFRVLAYGSHVQINTTRIEHGGPVRSKSGMSARALYEKRGTSVIMGHTHRLSQASHRNSLGQHTMIENGCLCLLTPEYGEEPDWTQGFTFGYVNNGSVHWYTVPILTDGFRADGRFYRRER